MTERANPMSKAKAAREAIKNDSTEGKKAPKAEEIRATFIVDKAKLKKLKIFAATNEMQIKEVIDQAITEYLENHKKK